METAQHLMPEDAKKNEIALGSAAELDIESDWNSCWDVDSQDLKCLIAEEQILSGSHDESQLTVSLPPQQSEPNAQPEANDSAYSCDVRSKEICHLVVESSSDMMINNKKLKADLERMHSIPSALNEEYKNLVENYRSEDQEIKQLCNDLNADTREISSLSSKLGALKTKSGF